jgi:phage terminase large subunit
MTKISLTLPFEYTPRPYQVPLLSAIDSGYKRACVLWHRRSGKDLTLLNMVAKKMYERVGAYYYFLPTYNQAKKIIWNGMDREGHKFLDHIPQELRLRTNDSEMLIETKNGSIFQLVGTNNIDSIVGTNPIGCVFSEYSLQDPKAWDFIRPILAENGGWAVFNFTPRGHNHGFDLWKLAESDPKNWFTQKLTVDDTKAIPPEVLEQEKREIVDKYGNEALYLQEYYCSFEAPVQGSYYGIQILKAEEDKRITNVPIESTIPVNTVWDLGINDTTAIWFWQDVGQEVRLIDYYEASGEGLAHYAKVLQDKHYLYGTHYAPHDIEVRELGSGKSRIETARSLGINFQLVTKLSIEDGIEAARNIWSKVWLDKTRCERGLNALKSYHKEYDEENKTYRNHPEHDWSSNGSDSFRYLAVAHKKRQAVYNTPVYTPSDPVIGV